MPVVAAGDDHGEQARMDRRLLGHAEMRPARRYPRRRRCRRPSAAPAPEDRRCVRRLHPRAVPLRGMSNRGRLCLVRGRTSYWRVATLAASAGNPIAQRRKAGVRSMPHFVCNLPTKPQPGAERSGQGRARTALWHSRQAGTRRMVALDDTVGAFVPGPRLERAPLGSGRLSGLGFAVKDLFDVAGSITTYGNPDWASTHAAAIATAPVVTALLQAGARLVGKTKTVELAYGLTGENVWQGTPINPRAPGPVPRRVELRLGRRGRRGAGRFRAWLRHRRIGAHPGKLLRPVRHPPEPRRGQPGRRLPAGAELRHLRLVRPERGVAGGRGRRAAARRPPGGGRPAAAGRGGLGQRPAGGGRGAAPGAGAARAVARQGGRHPAGPRGDRQHLRPLPHRAGGGGLGIASAAGSRR